MITTSIREKELVLEIHRELVAIPSLSHQEGPIADWVEQYLRARGATVERVGNNVLARAGRGPRLLLNSHLDTVPPTPRWTREPWKVASERGKIFGLGSNDAKGPAAAMIAAFLEVLDKGGPCETQLMLVPEEETGGKGTEVAWPWLRERGWIPEGAVVGEPTGLDIAIAQKGQLVLEIAARGDGGHSAHAARLGRKNAIRALARDLVALERIDLGAAHSYLGAATLEPTMISGGEAKNMVPVEARSTLDLRTVPGLSHEEIIERVKRAIESELRTISLRLKPVECAEDSAIVRAARAARPASVCFGSPTVSDWVFLRDLPAIKCGPGNSDRSHQPDEFIYEEELVEGVRFYSALIEAFAGAGGGQP